MRTSAGEPGDAASPEAPGAVGSELARRAAAAGSAVELAGVAGGLAEAQARLLEAGGTARQVGAAIGAFYDAATARLVTLATERLGPAPRPFAWAVAGSQARHEQSFHTDQDHVLVLADGEVRREEDAWFDAMSREVVAGLVACGQRACGGEVMASNPAWRLTGAGWRQALHGWMAAPGPKALMYLSLFLDLRGVAGAAGLVEPVLADARARAHQDHLLLAHLAAHAASHRTPLGLFGRLRLSSAADGLRALDLKLGGVMPVVELARVVALSEGVPAIGTVERLRAAGGTAVLSLAGARELEGALALFGLLRARLHCAQAARGVPPGERLDPRTLARDERGRLREAFRAVRRHQEVLGHHFGAAWAG